MSYELIVIKLCVGFAGLWTITRLLGKKEIAQLTPFDFISSLVLSEIVGNTIYDKEVTLLHLLLAFGVWAALSFLFEFLTFRVKRLRGPLDGRPSVLIHNGVIDRKEMNRNKLDFEQLRLLLRMQNVFSLREVAYAVYETNGSLTVLKKSAFESVERRDLNLPEEAVGLPVGLIEDGEVQLDELSRCGKDPQWLLEELHKNGYSRPEEVLYAEWTPENGLHLLAADKG
ncbi:YetF domain-containing protein [Gorillibacterium sp. sgz500922]|uniref:YetF domain-containing protein n=1 Tax=Gorillibacterium sp. sgz500922 TaxID=3446694 RepID=UPI003F66C3B1